MDHSCFKFSIGNFSIPVISGYDTYSVKIVGFAFGLSCNFFFWGGELHIMYWVKESDGKMWKEGEYSIAL